MSAIPEPSRATAERRIQAVDHRYYAARNWILAILFVATLVNGLVYWQASHDPERPAPTIMEFTRAQANGPTALCPGDVLDYDVALHVAKAGVFDLDVAVWRVDPPATVLYSQTRRMVFSGPTDYSLARRWLIPDFYSSPTDGSPERWAAGRYERRHAIVTVSRSTEPSIVSIPFTIKPECD